MSTFDGHVAEFPDIRIDRFRSCREGQRPALAYFLSHVHSDHLVGLESCRSPFIYCSAATREILLRLEKYSHRINFARGILERRVQTYRHLKLLLKPIPLDVPTELVLAPGCIIRVTLFEANHCTGAVMFLIEGGGKAILYTGDVRSESWWLDSLKRHPVLIPYVWGDAGNPTRPPLKRLDNIYLDTTFATKANPFRAFPEKREGIVELLEKVSQYPNHTQFYFDSWTFGYEEVWQALSVFLHSRIHVDNYRYGLYSALCHSREPQSKDAAMLIGSSCGNHFHRGCLTTSQDARIHSCERGMGCPIWEKSFVRITPIISRHQGIDMDELGTGGGYGDLDQQHVFSLGDEQLHTIQAATEPATNSTNIALRNLRSISSMQGILDNDHSVASRSKPEIPLSELIAVLSTKKIGAPVDQALISMQPSSTLPSQIKFPFSRHSSYSELTALVEAFLPRDIHPCTVDNTSWSFARSMTSMFGHLYMPLCQESKPFVGKLRNTHASDDTVMFSHDSYMLSQLKENDRGGMTMAATENGCLDSPPSAFTFATPTINAVPPATHDIMRQTFQHRADIISEGESVEVPNLDSKPPSAMTTSLFRSQSARLALRREAYSAALGIHDASWEDIRLVSVHGQHAETEEEL